MVRLLIETIKWYIAEFFTKFKDIQVLLKKTDNHLGIPAFCVTFGPPRVVVEYEDRCRFPSLFLFQAKWNSSLIT